MSTLRCRRSLSKLVSGFKSRCQSLATRTAMSIFLVELVAASPIGCLPVSPSNLPSKRKACHRSFADSSPQTSHFFHKSRPQIYVRSVTSDLVIDQESSSSRMHLSRLKKVQEEGHCQLRTTPVERKTPNPLLVEGRRAYWVKLMLLLVLLFAFLSIGKIAAFSITSSAFVLFKLIWNVRLRRSSVFSQSHMASFIFVHSPAKRREEEAACSKNRATPRDVEMSLSVNIPCRKCSSVAISLPSMPIRTGILSVNDAPGFVNSVESTNSVPKLLCLKACCLDSNSQTGTSATRMMKIEQLDLQGKKIDGFSSESRCHSIVAVILIILGGLLLGRVYATVGFSCWVLLVAKLRQRKLKQTLNAAESARKFK